MAHCDFITYYYYINWVFDPVLSTAGFPILPPDILLPPAYVYFMAQVNASSFLSPQHFIDVSLFILDYIILSVECGCSMVEVSSLFFSSFFLFVTYYS